MRPFILLPDQQLGDVVRDILNEAPVEWGVLRRYVKDSEAAQTIPAKVLRPSMLTSFIMEEAAQRWLDAS